MRDVRHEGPKTDNPVVLVRLSPGRCEDRADHCRLPHLTFWHIHGPAPSAIHRPLYREFRRPSGSHPGFHTRFHCSNFINTHRSLETRIDCMLYLSHTGTLTPSNITHSIDVRASVPTRRQSATPIRALTAHHTLRGSRLRAGLTKGILEASSR